MAPAAQHRVHLGLLRKTGVTEEQARPEAFLRTICPGVSDTLRTQAPPTPSAKPLSAIELSTPRLRSSARFERQAATARREFDALERAATAVLHRWRPS
jgi:hypothetical protein